MWAQYTLVIDEARRSHVMEALKASGIPTHIYYPRPLHHQPAYRHFPVAGNGLPVSEKLASSVLSLPMHPYLHEADQARIAEALLAAIAGP